MKSRLQPKDHVDEQFMSMREIVQPVIAALPKARERSAAPKTGPAFVLHSI